MTRGVIFYLTCEPKSSFPAQPPVVMMSIARNMTEQRWWKRYKIAISWLFALGQVTILINYQKVFSKF